MPRSNTDPPLHLQMTAPVGAKQLGLAEAAAAGQCQSRSAPHSPALPAAPALALDLPLLPCLGIPGLLPPPPPPWYGKIVSALMIEKSEWIR